MLKPRVDVAGLALSQAGREPRQGGKVHENQCLAHLIANRGRSRFLDRVLIRRGSLPALRRPNPHKSSTYACPGSRRFLDRVLIESPLRGPRKRKAPMTLTEAMAPTGHSQSTCARVDALFRGDERVGEIWVRHGSALSLTGRGWLGRWQSHMAQALAHLFAKWHEARFLDRFLIEAGASRRGRWISLFKSMTCERFMALIFLDRVLIEGGCCPVEP